MSSQTQAMREIDCTHPWATTEIGVNNNRPYCQGCGLDWQAVLEAEKQRAEMKAAERHEPRPRRYALQTPSGNVVGMGTEKPQLSRQDKRDGWRVIPLGA